MKKLTAIATLILSTFSFAYAKNFSPENQKFIESVIKKQLPEAKYNEKEQYWYHFDESFEDNIEVDLKEMHTPNGKIGALSLNYREKKLYPSVYLLPVVYLYELIYSDNEWKIKASKKHNIGDYWRDWISVHIIELGSQKFGFEVYGHSGGLSSGEGESQLYYPVGGEYKKLGSICLSKEIGPLAPLDFSCQLKVRNDLPENDGFYPIEIKYYLSKYFIPDESYQGPTEGKDWEYRSGFSRKLIDDIEKKVIVQFDSQKQEYIVPAELIKIFDLYMETYDDNKVWEYFKKQ